MQKLVLDKSGQATFDANGRAVIRLGPEKARERWVVRRVTVSTTSNATSTATTYKGVETPSRRLDGTVRGNQDTSEDDSYSIESGEGFLCVWSGGTPGAIATLFLLGDIEFGR